MSGSEYQADFYLSLNTRDPVEATRRLAEVTYAVSIIKVDWFDRDALIVNLQRPWPPGPIMPDPEAEQPS